MGRLFYIFVLTSVSLDAGRADLLNVKKTEIVEAGKRFAMSLGAIEAPSVSQNFLARIGLVDKAPRFSNNNRRRFDDYARFDRGGHRRDSFNSGRRSFDRSFDRNDRFERHQDRFDRPRRHDRNDRNDRFRSDRAPRRDRFDDDAPALKPSGRKWGSESF